jgi:hypothetical protein
MLLHAFAHDAGALFPSQLFAPTDWLFHRKGVFDWTNLAELEGKADDSSNYCSSIMRLQSLRVSSKLKKVRGYKSHINQKDAYGQGWMKSRKRRKAETEVSWRAGLFNRQTRSKNHEKHDRPHVSVCWAGV